MVNVLTGWKSIAAELGVSVRTAHRLRISSGLPAVNLSPRLVAVKRDDLERWWLARPGRTEPAAPVLLREV